MAKHRYIDTRFWHDNFIRESLNPLDRYLFLYFLTNDKTNICGIYELPLSMIASETGIEREMLLKMFKQLKGKIDYIDGWVSIRNFQKYQSTANPKIKTGIDNEMAKIPDNIREKIGYLYPMDRQSHLNSNSNSNSNSIPSPTPETTKQENKDIQELIFLFKDINPSYENLFKRPPQRAAIERLLKKFGREKCENTIKALPEIINKKFAPRITTPVQLEDKLGDLIAFVKQEKDTRSKIKVAIIT